MKHLLLLLFFTTFINSYSQKKVVKKFSSESSSIEINTTGLDDFVLENSDSESIEITLFAENPTEHNLVVVEKSSNTSIQFFVEESTIEEAIFRKFITKRLQRASAIVKIPKNKQVYISGDNINITSKDYLGNISIFIEKGIVKLNHLTKSGALQLYAGTIYATLKDTNINVVSNLGTIKVDGVAYVKNYIKTEKYLSNNFKVYSIKANILLSTQKEQ